MCFGHILISLSLNKQALSASLNLIPQLLLLLMIDCSFTSLKANRKTVIVRLLQHILLCLF